MSAEIVQFLAAMQEQEVKATTPRWPHAFARFKVSAHEFLAE